MALHPTKKFTVLEFHRKLEAFMKPFELTFLQITIFLSILFLGIVISPFLTTLVLAAILVTGANPVYEWVLIKVKGRKRTAAAIVSLSLGVLFSLIFFIFILLLSQEAVSTYQGLDTWIREGKFNLNQLIAKASKFFGIPRIDLTESISQAAQTFSSALVTESTNLLRRVVSLILNVFLLVFSMYFFFKDGDAIVKFMEKVMPLPRPYGEQILKKFKQVSLAMLYGIFLTAIAQGVIGGIGLWIAGIRNPIFWGTVMAFFGMLPVAGTGIVWLPAGLFLLATEHYVAGIFLLLWGACLVAIVDNIIKPLVIAKQTQTYPLATFLVVIGGLLVFGLKGAIIAPMVLAGMMSLIHIYQMERG